MTTRIYKNEYKVNHLDFIRKTYNVVSESDNVVVISGDEKELEKAMMGMFNTDEQFKGLFPAFQTERERKAYTQQQIKQLADVMRNTLLNIINNGIICDDFFELRELYLNKFINK